MKTKLRVALLAVAVVVAVVATITSAGAVGIPSTRAASPGAGYHWGIEVNATNFPGTTGIAPRSLSGFGFAYGGWTTAREFKAIGQTTTGTFTPVIVTLGEPYLWTGGGTPTLAIPYYSLSYADPRAGALRPYLTMGGHNDTNTAATESAAVYCSTTEWALSSAFIKRTYTGTFGALAPLNGGNLVTTYGTTNYPSNCKYVQLIEYTVCVVPDATTTVVCTKAIWTAESAFDKYSYTNLDPANSLCTTAAASAVSVDCQFVTGVSDPTDFNQVCSKNAPTAVWLDFSWLPAVIGHYGKCLFEPKGGWDRDAEIADAMETGSAGELVDAVDSLGTALTITESCGSIIDGSQTPLGESFIVSTCTWIWALPIKEFLSIAFPLWAGLWLVGFVFAAIAGVVGRKVPSPMSDES